MLQETVGEHGVEKLLVAEQCIYTGCWRIRSCRLEIIMTRWTTKPNGAPSVDWWRRPKNTSSLDISQLPLAAHQMVALDGSKNVDIPPDASSI